MVSVNDASAQLLAQALDDLSVDHERCSLDEATPKFEDARVDLLTVSFHDPAAAETAIQALRHSSMSKTAVTIGLVDDPARVTQAFGTGANFVLFEPLAAENTRASLRAAIALLQRERRRQFRVPVQLPVTLNCNGAAELEGIMLDLSEGGMDVLAAKALEPRQRVDVKFCLSNAPEMLTRAQVVWANSNGQSGLQFIEVAEDQSRALSSWLGANAPQAAPDDPEPLSEYKLSDLSLGGCYVETLAPFPRNTRIDVCLRVGDFEIHLDGHVRVVYPGHGMGVEFVPGANQKELVLSLIDRLMSQPGATPDLLIWPKGFNFNASIVPETSASEDGPEDALVKLLCSTAPLSQDEFLTELRRQRRSQPEEITA